MSYSSTDVVNECQISLLNRVVPQFWWQHII